MLFELTFPSLAVLPLPAADDAPVLVTDEVLVVFVDPGTGTIPPPRPK